MKAWIEPACRVAAVAVWLCGVAVRGDDTRPQDPPATPAGTRAAEPIPGNHELKKEPEPSSYGFKGYASPWLREVMKLVEARVEESVVRTFIENAGTFSLTSDHLIRLNELDFPPGLILGMLQHDAEIAAGLRPEPVPPPSSTPALKVVTKKPVPPKPPTPAPPKPAVAAESSIVNPSPAPDYWEFFEVMELRSASDIRRAPHTIVTRSKASVRQPYAVELTDPIFVHRTAGRVPNTVYLESFP